ncbi:hypothetical protein [Aquimarina sp. 2201CG14-23]|uniref:hypothetical protein n=1 Tax=Aquimarina mycalae TaxID=3040073 RepID=UPI002477D5AF|nr:hypothetical protein [Aquimarina sp. 2201CG14-23]MDH7446090.1 hypothetical protein [Aquimarina sp. 2201CG14-23]
MLDRFFIPNNHFLSRNTVSIIISIFCILNIAYIFPDIHTLFGDGSFIQAEINNRFVESHEPILEWYTNIFAAIGLSKDTSILIIFTIYLSSLLLIVFNFKRSLFAFLAWFIHISIINSSHLFSYGADYFISFALFINFLINLTPLFKKETSQILYSFIIRFTQIQLCIVYFFAGFGKALGKDWLDGNAVWYVVNEFSPGATKFMLNFVDYPILFKVMSWSVFIELLYPILIFIPKTKKITLIMIIGLHLSIGIFMKFYSFGAIMIILNIMAFGHYLKPEYDMIRGFIVKKKLLPQLLR